MKTEASGPGPRTADGSHVQLYRLLEPRGEPEIIESALSPGASILELGSGVGRITHPLVRNGFSMVAVDNSPDMLEFVQGADKVLSDIETLHLKREFDAVLLMSHFVDTSDVALRQALLAACRRHVAPDGVVIVQRHDPKWLELAATGPLATHAGVEAFLDRVVRCDAEVEMTIRWQSRDSTWTQSFTVRRLDDQEINRALAESDLQFHRWLDVRQTWFTARRT